MKTNYYRAVGLFLLSEALFGSLMPKAFTFDGIMLSVAIWLLSQDRRPSPTPEAE